MDLKEVSWKGMVVAAVLAATTASWLRAADDVAGNLVLLNDNGAWCWYEGERAIIHDEKLIVSSVADGSDFLNAVSTRAGAQWLFIAPLGRFEIAGPVDIHVRAQLGASGDDRTWYDGVGYALICNDPFADFDGDWDVDLSDFGALQACLTGQGGGVNAGCACFDRPEGGSGGDNDVDNLDLDAFVNCFTGPSIEWAPTLTPACDP